MQRIPHILDAVIVSTSTISTIAANIMLANVPVNEINYYNELRLLLIPLIGAMLVSGGMIMLNPQPETRQIVLGRSIFALLAGVIAPNLLGFVHPVIQSIALRPAVLLAVGGATAGIVYALSKPFCAGLYQRAEQNAKKVQDALEAHLDDKISHIGVERKTVTITTEQPKSVVTTETTSEK